MSGSRPSGALLLVMLVGAGGCAPLADFRPTPGFLEERTWEVGAGGVLLSPRPYANDPWRGAGQAWLTRRLGTRVSLGAVSAFDDESAAAGATFRVDYLHTDRVAGGVGLEAGYLWAGISLPFAVRLFDQTWVYTAPRLTNLGHEVAPIINLGVSARLWDGLVLRVESHLSWAAFRYYNRRVHLGLAVAYQW